MNNQVPNHIAIILDGNGRWATKRNLLRTVGHHFGIQNIFKIVEHAKKLEIKELSLFCFSTENWLRPQTEVDYLMSEPLKIFEQNRDKISETNIRFKHIGNQDKIPKELKAAIDFIVDKTKDNLGMLVNVCFDYGGRDEITKAAMLSCQNKNNFIDNLQVKSDVDLLIRTGGELRISNFLLWQSAYAELYFSKKMWPAFKAKDFDKAIKAYTKRKRRFGGLT